MMNYSKLYAYTTNLFLLILICIIPLKSSAMIICPNNPGKIKESTNINDTKWFKTNKQVKSVSILIHGLNQLPSKLDFLAAELNTLGSDVLRLTLTGHAGDMSKFLKVTEKTWLKDFENAYCQALKKSLELGVPLFLCGYSLGGLVGVNSITQGTNVDKIILFAPALSIHNFTYTIRALFWPLDIIPSFAPKPYRAHSGTTVNAYKSLFNLIEKLENSNKLSLNVNTLIFIDPDDELVSPTGIKEFIDHNNLTNWKMKYISNKGAKLEKYHHLITDNIVLPEDQWKQIMDSIKNHIQN